MPAISTTAAGTNVLPCYCSDAPVTMVQHAYWDPVLTLASMSTGTTASTDYDATVSASSSALLSMVMLAVVIACVRSASQQAVVLVIAALKCY